MASSMPGSACIRSCIMARPMPIAPARSQQLDIEIGLNKVLVIAPTVKIILLVSDQFIDDNCIAI